MRCELPKAANDSGHRDSPRAVLVYAYSYYLEFMAISTSWARNSEEKWAMPISYQFP